MSTGDGAPRADLGPDRPEQREEHTWDLKDVVREERRVILGRREGHQLLGRGSDPGARALAGLAMSGGGVRSACFNLGLIEAFDDQAFDPSSPSPPTDPPPGVDPPGASRHERPRYLELFDYVSSVSGGSYVAGHLATTMIPHTSGGQAARPDGRPDPGPPRLGRIEFASDSVPRWFWAVGVWFVGLAFQLVKTGALLIAGLGFIALVFRALDGPYQSRFCGLFGLGSDIPRGFVPFWIASATIAVAYLLRDWPRLTRLWLWACASVALVYGACVLLMTCLEHPEDLPTRIRGGDPAGAIEWADLDRFWFGAHWIFLVVAAGSALAFIGVGLIRGRSEGGSKAKWLFMIPPLVALFCLAGLVTTGDIGVTPRAEFARRDDSSELSKHLTELGDHIFRAAIAALGLGSLAFIRWPDLLRSTRAVTDRLSTTRWRPVYQVVVFLSSYGFLLLLVFVLYGALARENISGIHQRREADPEEAFNFRDFRDWDRAWERIEADASGMSPWRDLASAMIRARGEANSLSGFGLAKEAVISEQIRELQSLPFFRRLGNGRELHHLDSMRQAGRDGVARRVAGQVLDRADLYSEAFPRFDEASAWHARSVDGTARDGDRDAWGKYLRRAAYLKAMKKAASPDPEGAVEAVGKAAAPDPEDSKDPLQASIRQNNREGLKLYLGDLMRDRAAGTSADVIFASVVWRFDQWIRLQVVAIALGTWLLCCLVDVNRFSLHTFYREHVIDRWLDCRRGPSGSGWLHEAGGSYRGLAGGSARTEGGTDDRRPEEVAVRRAPLPLINATVQGHRSLGDDPELQRNIFTFSPVALGSAETGFWIVRPGGRAQPFYRRERIDVGQIVAISGAFLSPGQVANPALAAILHLLNVRTGWWFRDRDHAARRREAGPPPRLPAAFGAVKEWLGFHVFQSLGIDREGDSRYLLTDGAHVENLGLKVLLDRRCALIVASDCSQDDGVGHPFGALIEVLHQARIEGVEIGPFLTPEGLDRARQADAGGPGGRPDRDSRARSGLDLILPRIPAEPEVDLVVPPAPSKPKRAQNGAKHPGPGVVTAGDDRAARDGDRGPGPGALDAVVSDGREAGSKGAKLSREHYLFAPIRYSTDDEATGLLVYVRPTLTGDEGESLLRRSPDSQFPDDPPLDQFYTASRMNTYRLLGRHIGRELARDPRFRSAMEGIYGAFHMTPTPRAVAPAGLAGRSDPGVE